jgi:hypothetical protein
MSTTRRMSLGASACAARRILGANDRIRVAVVDGRGQSQIDAFHQLAGENVEIAALCDVEQSVLEQRAGAYERKSGRKAAQYSDMRQVLDDKSIDAVGLAPPNQRHARCAVWACQAGKDVDVEKPGTYVFSEVFRTMEAAAKYRRIVQHGTRNCVPDTSFSSTSGRIGSSMTKFVKDKDDDRLLTHTYRPPYTLPEKV